MTKYVLEVKVMGWLTREVEAHNISEAMDKAADLDWSMPIGDLRWRQTEVEHTKDD